MKSSTKPFPKTKIQWLWENRKESVLLYLIGMIGTVLYNVRSLRFHIFREKLLTCF